MTKIALALVMRLLSSLPIPVAFADDDAAKQVVGTWQLSAWTVQVVGEPGSREPYGPNPKGRLVLTPRGHWIIIITGANRTAAKTAEEKAALLDSMIAYAGKYRIEGDKVTTRVDISSSEFYTGASQDVVRYFKVDGDKLVLRTPEIASAVLVGKRESP